ncbi:phosphate ABC transporter ATP-binding protein [Haloferax mediterranei ATCC 33500]|uniref:Phosphate ABC transporter ATP-binding protein n=1 Tax=Haloferax mediterranei (strain ATCC 33500 / DSM 1411 / JCM 8866 / NBRC 14739 / NCIMB 2177 / R-4) TaxID=523841 RepID=I3R613_HALMT|nr:phosphate ABC transporter ATP-binding protein [Haloferax mediterranei]AFK19673.1 phosphate ABC transporter ATP-binding protein [Haloferax mediterranei ATCC 33500]AHZ23062.1 phosphate ABC transporter ATP-binding protein [Haloferax mediterranei ATCC 33500]ELZ99993.1 phosphate ABC transporter ATP-binding protein [Haloferax mediterranei ATCC 33500]MDX5987585.1 phosphate ABC transporter ATP-binding protein [Haloferax mediterranei ATCC 33500]QCQ74074.1 phosphate ABC transporter ATP-binding protei
MTSERRSPDTHESAATGEKRAGTRLAARNLSHGFENGAILEDISIAVEPGEILAVVGPSGTGKTTLFRLLAMFERPTDGTVEVDGDDVWELPEERRLAVRRRVGMAFQSRSLFSSTVVENVSYGLRVRRAWSARLRDAVESAFGSDEPSETVVTALQTVGMADKIHRDAASLSAGEAQRVAIARALAPDPDVLLLDEPTSNLDPRNTAAIESAMRAARDRGIAVALATHDMQQAQRVSDRTAVLLDGTCIESGPTAQVFESPADDRVRRFVEGKLVY